MAAFLLLRRGDTHASGRCAKLERLVTGGHQFSFRETQRAARQAIRKQSAPNFWKKIPENVPGLASGLGYEHLPWEMVPHLIFR